VNRALIAASFAACAALMPDRALAASRARYGGTLRAAIAGRPPEAEPSLADSPSDAAVLSLTANPPCRLDGARRIRPVLASEIGWRGPLKLNLELRPGIKFESGTAVSARDVVASWSRLSRPGSLSPYRALLFPLRSEGQRLSSAAVSAQNLELPLAFSWPDLVGSLCHPALAIRPATEAGFGGVGPFRATSTAHEFDANLGFPLGRPFVDKLALAFTDERGAARQLALGQAQVAVGAAGPRASARDSQALYATYLAFKLERAGADFRRAFEATIDRDDLTRFFVPAPSAPMHSLLPPALMPQEPISRPAAPAQAAGRALTLMFDQSLPEQRLVAERLQVKLHDLKYAIALRPVPRADLRAAWSTGNFDLMLHAVLLPPFAGPALALAIETSGRHELLSTELPAIGALADDADRERAALERARALLPSLPLIPLYAQAVNLVARSEVASLGVDGYGLPALDDAFLLPE
jgi:MarR-like DNA-binding transcriptional regulator SgrR of sgrS sRNA